jgi:hypothetical protein
LLAKVLQPHRRSAAANVGAVLKRSPSMSAP